MFQLCLWWLPRRWEASRRPAMDTFEQDFAFMADAGYKVALYTKGRMRSATFWLASVFEEVAPRGLWNGGRGLRDGRHHTRVAYAFFLFFIYFLFFLVGLISLSVCVFPTNKAPTWVVCTHLQRCLL